jgi:hypothetical protein
LTSTFTWLDHSEHERRQMLDVIELFRERDTRDELGLGTIRDAFADLFFPGTSTIQTRARYFFIVPWMYLELEGRRTSSAACADRVRRYETSLIDAVLESGETDGVLGRVAGRSLQRLPSNIYWQGLGILGIRLFPGSQPQYYRSLDRFYLLKGRQARDDDGEPVGGGVPGNWHPGLPEPPEEFARKASLKLTRLEARYLQERITARAPESLLRFLAERGRGFEELEFPWQHPQFGEFPSHCQEQLRHARNFSEAMHGASLLYNLMLSEMAANEELVSEYKRMLKEWAETVRSRHSEFVSWDRAIFWQTVASRGARVSRPTRVFVERWLDLLSAEESSTRLAVGKTARSLVHDRERALKRGLARLDNRRALELWSGAAGTAQLNYRWRIAQRIVKDIHQGLSQDGRGA